MEERYIKFIEVNTGQEKNQLKPPLLFVCALLYMLKLDESKSIYFTESEPGEETCLVKVPGIQGQVISCPVDLHQYVSELLQGRNISNSYLGKNIEKHSPETRQDSVEARLYQAMQSHADFNRTIIELRKHTNSAWKKAWTPRQVPDAVKRAKKVLEAMEKAEEKCSSGEEQPETPQATPQKTPNASPRPKKKTKKQIRDEKNAKRRAQRALQKECDEEEAPDPVPEPAKEEVPDPVPEAEQEVAEEESAEEPAEEQAPQKSSSHDSESKSYGEPQAEVPRSKTDEPGRYDSSEEEAQKDDDDDDDDYESESSTHSSSYDHDSDASVHKRAKKPKASHDDDSDASVHKSAKKRKAPPKRKQLASKAGLTEETVKSSPAQSRNAAKAALRRQLKQRSLNLLQW
jgi:hypothetical protein